MGTLLVICSEKVRRRAVRIGLLGPGNGLLGTGLARRYLVLTRIAGLITALASGLARGHAAPTGPTVCPVLALATPLITRPKHV